MESNHISYVILRNRWQLIYLQGLSESQVKVNMNKYGENVFEPPAHTPEWLVIIKHLFGGFSCLLLLGAVLCFWAAWMQQYFLEDLSHEYVIWHFWQFSLRPCNILGLTHCRCAFTKLYVGAVLIFVIFVSGACSYYQERKRDVIMVNRMTGYTKILEQQEYAFHTWVFWVGILPEGHCPVCTSYPWRDFARSRCYRASRRWCCSN